MDRIDSDTIAYDRSFFDYLKISLAVAIIRSKPKGTSGEDYARILSQKLQLSEATWKAKADDLERKLLKANQENVYLRLKYEQITDTENEPMTSNDSKVSYELNEENVARNVQFMKQVAALKWHEKSNAIKTAYDECKVVRTSVINAVEAMSKSIEEAGLNERLISALEDSTGVLEGFLLDKYLSHDEDLKRSIIKLLEQMMRKIMNERLYGDYETQEKLSKMVLLLGANSVVLQTVIGRITGLIKAYTELLAGNESNCKLIDADKFENMYYILWIMEQILKKSKADTTILDNAKSEICGKLQANVCGLLETFPMFVHYIWKLTAMIEEREFENHAKQSAVWKQNLQSSINWR